MAPTHTTAAFDGPASYRNGRPDIISVPRAFLLIGGTSLLLWFLLWRCALWGLSILA